VKSQLTWSFRDNWNAYIEADYTGARYRAGDVANQASQLGGYTVINASLRWQYLRWFAQLRLNNVFDKAYSTFSGVDFSGNYYYPAAERNGQILVGLQF
jgi:iron complex outermembrane receptor protein